MMYGHGYFKHTNGYEYEGLFENNFPVRMPTKLVILTSDELASDSKMQKFEIYESQNFRLWVRVVNDEGEHFQGLFFQYILKF